MMQSYFVLVYNITFYCFVENTEKTSETSVVLTYSFFHKTFDTTSIQD